MPSQRMLQPCGLLPAKDDDLDDRYSVFARSEVDLIRYLVALSKRKSFGCAKYTIRWRLMVALWWLGRLFTIVTVVSCVKSKGNL